MGLIWTLALIVALAWPMLVIHELSHALVVWAAGGRVTTFRPWPGVLTEPGHEPRWFVGHMEFCGSVGRYWFGLAPFLADVVLASVGLALGIPHLTPALVTVAAIDAAWHWLPAFRDRPGCDLDLWFDARDTPRRIAAVMTWAVLAWFLVLAWVV